MVPGNSNRKNAGAGVKGAKDPELPPPESYPKMGIWAEKKPKISGGFRRDSKQIRRLRAEVNDNFGGAATPEMNYAGSRRNKANFP